MFTFPPLQGVLTECSERVEGKCEALPSHEQCVNAHIARCVHAVTTFLLIRCFIYLKRERRDFPIDLLGAGLNGSVLADSSYRVESGGGETCRRGY